MESSPPPTVAKRLWHILRAVFYMLRKGVSMRKLRADLHLLIKSGKLAGKALGHLITFHQPHQQSAAAALRCNFSTCSCRSLDPVMHFYDPKEVEFSCSNTPSYGFFYMHAAAKRKSCRSRRRRRRREESFDGYDAVAVAKVIEKLNRETSGPESMLPSAFQTPSPVLAIGSSPIGRQLRISDSPFATHEEDAMDVNRIDKEADEFIKRFYEQLRRQQLNSGTATAEHTGRQR